MIDHCIDHAHAVGIVGRVFATQKENFARKFLTNLTGKICRTEATVKTCDICVCLFELCMFTTCQRQVADYVQTVATTGSPTGHDTDNNFWHETN